MRVPPVINVNMPTRTEYVTREVHEHRAPTDESVRLLDEFKSAAEAKVAQAIRVADTPIEMVVHIADDMLNDQVIYAAVFKINGKTHTARIHANRRSDRGSAAVALRDAVSREIANAIIGPALHQALQS